MAKKLEISALVIRLETVWVDRDGDDVSLAPGPELDPIKVGPKDATPELVQELKTRVAEFGEQQLAAATNQTPATPSTNGSGPAA